MRDIVNESNPTEYRYMTLLQKTYKAPAFLLHDSNLPIVRRAYLLKQWRDERTRYLYETCHDWDYQKDRQMYQLLKCVNKIKRLQS